MLEEIVIETAIGLLVMYMAYRTGWKGEAGLLHRYHSCRHLPAAWGRGSWLSAPAARPCRM